MRQERRRGRGNTAGDDRLHNSIVCVCLRFVVNFHVATDITDNNHVYTVDR